MLSDCVYTVFLLVTQMINHLCYPQCRLIYLLFLFRGVSGNVESKMWLDKSQFCIHPPPPIQVYLNYQAISLKCIRIFLFLFSFLFRSHFLLIILNQLTFLIQQNLNFLISLLITSGYATRGLQQRESTMREITITYITTLILFLG